VIIKKLHPEIVGKIPTKDEDVGEFLMAVVTDAFRAFQRSPKIQNEYTVFEYLLAKAAPIAKYFEPGFYPKVIHGVANDKICMEGGLIRSAYHEHPKYRANYIVAPDFFSVFRKVPLDHIDFSHLPSKNSVGYIFLEMPIRDYEGTKYPHCYFACGNCQDLLGVPSHRDLYAGENGESLKLGDKASDDVFVFNLISSAGIQRTGGTQIPKDRSILIKDWFANAEDLHTTFDRDRLAMSDMRGIGGYGAHLKDVVNLLVYLNSGQPDIRDFRNTIRYRGQGGLTPVNKDRDLSQLPLKLLGFSWKKENLKLSEGWTVGSHLRWQRCGPKLSEVRLITVKGHQKKWRTQEEASS